MELRHEFTVPVPVDDAWPALLDIERVAPCLPGATVEEYDGRTVTGSVKVKVGPVTVTYRGTAVFEERDGTAHRMVLAASGRETRGQGTARATVTATLDERDGGTAVSVLTDLTVTGRPAQFGRGVLAEVGERLVGRFAACLSEQLTRPPEAAEETGAVKETGGTGEAGVAGESVAADGSGAAVAAGAPQAARRAGAPQDEPLDLLRTAGLPVAKRAAAVLAGAVVLGLLIARIRARHRA
ncbi:SRPBCC family protein [Streptomyces prasinopilosus]|uniref:Carbon monoxide dehydrogenase subunit G n=1 Tax=Streptomyces prasinopilosus TaxID=67344 RepID=A0A1G6THU5_9ACTN|nr:SRPBCC family protein [Streptomyces prasinopilosus]SDD28589.1 Carbon monoxide dehydrogenase subunit G [Streptomyces prasinopilosus]